MQALNMLIRALLVWLLLILVESGQGALRHFLLSEATQIALRQTSVVIGAAVIFAITWFAMPWLRVRSARGAMIIGLGWMALTLVFELGVGRLTGASWSEIASDYDVPHGGIMPLGLLAMAFTPLAIRQLQTRRRSTVSHPLR